MPNDSPQTNGAGAPTSRMRIVVVVAIIIGLLAWVVIRRNGNGDASSTNGATPVVLPDVVKSGAARGFNLLFVTLDTTRPDRLGCYGYAEAATPTIDGLAEHGVRFDNAVSSVPITLPSHSVMMTGKYPPSIGVRYNGTDRLADEHVTLAEKFKQAGYATAGFVSAFVLEKRFGLAQGFDTYDFGISPDLERHNITLHNERRADDVTVAALNWLKQRPTDAPFFLWVHYFDPHAPHLSPLASLEQFRDRPYDAEIAFVDAQFRRLIDHLDKMHLRERTLVVVASDHGESLGEHGEAYHLVFVYEATTHAAIILSCPSLFDKPYCVNDRVVGLVDLYPTLIDLFGLEPESNLDGIDLLTRAWPQDRAIYLETVYPAEIGCSPLFALRRRFDKFILAPRAEYYNLRNDPQELNNQFAENAKQAGELRERLTALLDTWSSQTAQTSVVEMSQEDIERLTALGYTAPTTSGKQFVDNDCDPKDHIEVINGMSELKKYAALGERDEAIRVGKELVAAAEGFAEPVRTLASLYIEKGDWDSAIQTMSTFVRKHPEPYMVYLLASAYDHEGHDAECEQTLGIAERLAPDLGAVPMLRGDRALRAGELRKALEYYERALALDPDRIGPDVQPKIYEVRKRLDSTEP
ncbi:MAG: sulfatase-like hydrolase/transferase [Phycisphaerales bacterium]|nr:sulfatase-like hydrolase/transferase [Phycisphaerales bacterium]